MCTSWYVTLLTANLLSLLLPFLHGLLKSWDPVVVHFGIHVAIVFKTIFILLDGSIGLVVRIVKGHVAALPFAGVIGQTPRLVPTRHIGLE